MSGSQAWKGMGKMHEQMMQGSGTTSEYSSKLPSPVTVFKPNEYGIRGLRENVSEWGLRTLEGTHEGKITETEYVILGEIGDDPEKQPPSPISRYPWEAFEEVGFRCVVSARGFTE